FGHVERGIFAALATACPPRWGESVSPRRPDMFFVGAQFTFDNYTSNTAFETRCHSSLPERLKSPSLLVVRAESSIACCLTAASRKHDLRDLKIPPENVFR